MEKRERERDFAEESWSLFLEIEGEGGREGGGGEGRENGERERYFGEEREGERLLHHTTVPFPLRFCCGWFYETRTTSSEGLFISLTHTHTLSLSHTHTHTLSLSLSLTHTHTHTP